ncbi:MAG: glycerol-3-phosphate dehydrogenase [Blastocatellia bacterium]|jgi:glycerol-3-phosphate dehydrogenase|nr:glycerol-3-phosphate dehydrogenase [Blastocatellia bacterium]
MDRLPTNLQTTTYDVIVIGAGINGAGISRDAAMRGLKVLLLDKGDIGSGTSSWSTRLIHGGLRYLEHGEFGLVRESLREREVLLRIAPHLVRPLPLLLPIYRGAGRGKWTIRAGMLAYDALSFDKTLPRHRMLSPAEARQQAPGINSEGLVGAAVYCDAQVEFAERLVWESALSAREHGATVITYARVDRFIFEAETIAGVAFSNELQGTTESARANFIINAAGPWIDQVLSQSAPGSLRLIGGTKGSHLIVAPFPGAPAAALYTEAQADRRPFFIIPWNGNYLIGTTDVRYEGDLDRVRIEREEVDYLLHETNQLIPAANLTREKILYTYSGVRPLPFINQKEARSITRRHFIREHPQYRNLLSIVGGKLTTYRSLSEEVVDLIFRKMGGNSPECSTGKQPLPGAMTSDFKIFAKEFRVANSLPPRVSERLLRIYGTRAQEVVELVSQDPALGETFSNGGDALAAEVVYSFTRETATTLADCLLRRTMLGLNPSRGIGADVAVAEIACRHLGWSAARAEREVSDYRQYHLR